MSISTSFWVRAHFFQPFFNLFCSFQTFFSDSRLKLFRPALGCCAPKSWSKYCFSDIFNLFCFIGIRDLTLNQRFGANLKNLFFAKFYFKFLAFCIFLAFFAENDSTQMLVEIYNKYRSIFDSSMLINWQSSLKLKSSMDSSLNF